MNIAQQLDILEKTNGIIPFTNALSSADAFPLYPKCIEILQINTGKLCNLSCRHCHVEAGPDRKEIMSKDILSKCLEVVSRSNTINTIDITGGSPEMNPHLEWFISAASKLGKRLIVRSNLVILLENEYRHFIDVYTENKVEIVASLPDLLDTRTDRMRGNKVFARSIEVLKLLNIKGYAKKNSGLILDIVHNPPGAYLPASQKAIEHEYRQNLGKKHKIVFNNLFCIANMPVGRYLEYLIDSENYNDYLFDLSKQHNPGNLHSLMCRNTMSVAWDGYLFDCDFNQMLDLKLEHNNINHIDAFDEEILNKRKILIRNHCYGCTAGSGSSCQGCFNEKTEVNHVTR